MEALLKASTVVTTDAMRELALQRARVRYALLGWRRNGERLLAAPKLRASGEKMPPGRRA